MTTVGAAGSSRASLITATALVVIYLPYVVKRAFVVGTPGEVEWLIWDYSIRCVSLFAIFVYHRVGSIKGGNRPASMLKTIPIFIFALCCLFLLYIYVFPVLAKNLPYLRLFQSPIILNRELLVFDLTIGMALVAISEELAFRKVAFSLLRERGFGDGSIVILSSMAFALVHLTSGVASLLHALLAGLVLGTVYHVTGRLSVCVMLHFLDDFFIYGSRAAEAIDKAG